MLQLLILVLFGFSAWQLVRSGFFSAKVTDTAEVKLTAEEASALRRLLKPAPAAAPTGGTKVAIGQIRGLEERLAEIEKVTSPAGLSVSASSDLRVIQRDVENLKDREAFHAQVVKDQMAELGSQMRWMVGTMVTLNVAIIGFFWQLLIKGGKSKETQRLG